MFLYDFKCKCGNVFEGFAEISDKTHECERCGSKAVRLVSTPMINLEGYSGHFPTAKQKFIKRHEVEGRKTTDE